jgi:predicted phosphodiesterase
VQPTVPPILPTETSLPTPTETYAPPLSEELASISYAIPLIIRHITSTSALLFFELESPSPSILLYWPEGKDPQRAAWVDLPAALQRQEVLLEGLSPGVTYHAALGLTEGDEHRPPPFLGEAWDPILIETPGQDPFPLRVGVIGDAGFGDAVTVRLVEGMASADLDMVVHTGDLVYNVEENTDPREAFDLKLFKPFAPVLRQAAFYPVPGNHEFESVTSWNDRPYYDWAFPPLGALGEGGLEMESASRHYGFTRGNLQFLMLDSQAFYGSGSREEQNQWLAERLADESFAASIPVLHIPPFNSGRHASDGAPVASAWAPLFAQARVPLAISGHDHNYQRHEVDGLTYLVSGGGSAVLYPAGTQLESTRAFSRTSHFVLLEIWPEEIRITAISDAGAVLDEAVVSMPVR